MLLIGRTCEHYKKCLSNSRCMDCDGESLYKPSEKVYDKDKPKVKRKGQKTEKKVVKRTNDAIKKSIQRAIKKRSVRLTPNSGAGSIKGDAIADDIMQEMKERNHALKGGNKSFSIQKEWLEKLERESYGKPYYVLPFTFGENENKIYAIVDYDVFLSLYTDIVYLKQLNEKLQEFYDKNSKES